MNNKEGQDVSLYPCNLMVETFYLLRKTYYIEALSVTTNFQLYFYLLFEIRRKRR